MYELLNSGIFHSIFSHYNLLQITENRASKTVEKGADVQRPWLLTISGSDSSEDSDAKNSKL